MLARPLPLPSCLAGPAHSPSGAVGADRSGCKPSCLAGRTDEFRSRCVMLSCVALPAAHIVSIAPILNASEAKFVVREAASYRQCCLRKAEQPRKASARARRILQKLNVTHLQKDDQAPGSDPQKYDLYFPRHLSIIPRPLLRRIHQHVQRRYVRRLAFNNGWIRRRDHWRADERVAEAM